MSCNKCETKKCSCGKGSTPVMPPSECNTPTCPDPAPCSEIIPTACIQYVGESKLCGEDEVFAEGDTIGVIEGKIVDYFCERLSNVSEEVVAASTIVTQVDCGIDTVYETGDTIIEALEKTVNYFCTELSDINGVISGLAAVASSGAYSDLSGLPTALSDFSNDLLTADELAAINGANTPSALNTFATISDIPTAVSELTNDSGFITSDTNIYNTNGTLTGNRTVTGGGFSLTFNNTGNFQINSNVTDWNFGFRDVVGGYPSFVLQSPVNAFTDTRHIVNNAVVYRQYTGFNDFVQQIKNYQISDILSGRTQVIKNTLGEWLFTQDVTGLQTPEAGVRAKFYGTVKTVSPSASALDTAFAVRNNVDNANLLNIQGDGLFNLGASTFTDTQHVIRNTSSYFYIHRVLGTGENIIFDIARTYIKLAIATGIGTDAQAGRILTTDGLIKNLNTPVYADNASALLGGLVAGDQYRTALGVRMEVY